eukprot:TRINITY_DN6654_c0_g1_i2.p1 TRINITY_DN6654_c0_g1~~TRINITY_DN6654_c0_g1_i2.p1  ORF type:complete len:382 (+),score=116.37 TRINITY_DN6654_c0_g1_i2:60-1148(+)
MNAPEDDPTPSDEDDGTSFEVAKIIGRKTENGVLLYHVIWEGFPDAVDYTWEPLENVSSCPKMIENFEAEEREKNPSPRNPSKSNGKGKGKSKGKGKAKRLGDSDYDDDVYEPDFASDSDVDEGRNGKMKKKVVKREREDGGRKRRKTKTDDQAVGGGGGDEGKVYVHLNLVDDEDDDHDKDGAMFVDGSDTSDGKGDEEVARKGRDASEGDVDELDESEFGHISRSPARNGKRPKKENSVGQDSKPTRLRKSTSTGTGTPSPNSDRSRRNSGSARRNSKKELDSSTEYRVGWPPGAVLHKVVGARISPVADPWELQHYCEWERLNNEVVYENSFVDAELTKKKAPLLVIDYYESRLKFLEP